MSLLHTQKTLDKRKNRSDRGLRQRKVLEGIESLRQKHRGMKVLNSFDHVETWKSILNSFFDREGDCNSQWNITNVKLLDRPRYIFPPFFHIRRIIVTIYWCGYQAEHEKQSAILSFLTTAWRRSVKLIETSILNILNLGKDPGKQWKNFNFLRWEVKVSEIRKSSYLYISHRNDSFALQTCQQTISLGF